MRYMYVHIHTFWKQSISAKMYINIDRKEGSYEQLLEPKITFTIPLSDGLIYIISEKKKKISETIHA